MTSLSALRMMYQTSCMSIIQVRVKAVNQLCHMMKE